MTLTRKAAADMSLHAGVLNRAGRLELRHLAGSRLISNLLALVALFSIGFV